MDHLEGLLCDIHQRRLSFMIILIWSSSFKSDASGRSFNQKKDCLPSIGLNLGDYQSLDCGFWVWFIPRQLAAGNCLFLCVNFSSQGAAWARQGLPGSNNRAH
jgi:hypothetical protein